MPLQGFTAVDLGYQKGNVVSNFINRFDEPTFTQQYLQLFNQVWQDASQVEDVTEMICAHIESA